MIPDYELYYSLFPWEEFKMYSQTNALVIRPGRVISFVYKSGTIGVLCAITGQWHALIFL